MHPPVAVNGTSSVDKIDSLLAKTGSVYARLALGMSASSQPDMAAPISAGISMGAKAPASGRV